MQVALTHESAPVHALAPWFQLCLQSKWLQRDPRIGWVVWCYMHEHAPHMHVLKQAVDKNWRKCTAQHCAGCHFHGGFSRSRKRWYANIELHIVQYWTIHLCGRSSGGKWWRRWKTTVFPRMYFQMHVNSLCTVCLVGHWDRCILHPEHEKTMTGWLVH